VAGSRVREWLFGARYDRRAAKAVEQQLEKRGFRALDVAGATMLTNPVVLLDGNFRDRYAIRTPQGQPLGEALCVSGSRKGYVARYELRHPDGSPALDILVARDVGRQPDLVLDSDGRELVRLEKRWRGVWGNAREVIASDVPVGRFVRRRARPEFLCEDQTPPVARPLAAPAVVLAARGSGCRSWRTA
jgi:hypothetical protein